MEIAGFGGAERGASPVIGIVLLVAITVLVGAVVAGFTFDLGRTSTESLPNAQLDVEDAGEVVSESSDSAVLVVSHESGEDIDTDTLQLRIEQDDTTYYQGDMRQSTYASQSGSSGNLNSTAGAELEASGEIVLSEDESDSEEFPAGTYDITIIHEPSEGVLLEKRVKVD